MRMKNIKLRNIKGEGSRIVEIFKKAFEENFDVNLKTKYGYISYVGGILTKISNNGEQFIADNKGRWVKI